MMSAMDQWATSEAYALANDCATLTAKLDNMTEKEMLEFVPLMEQLYKAQDELIKYAEECRRKRK